jgi:hypothetical protein
VFFIFLLLARFGRSEDPVVRNTDGMSEKERASWGEFTGQFDCPAKQQTASDARSGSISVSAIKFYYQTYRRYDCDWTVDVAGQCQIEWKFNRFQIKESTFCENEFAEVFSPYGGYTGRMCEWAADGNIAATPEDAPYDSNPANMGFMTGYTNTFGNSLKVRLNAYAVKDGDGFDLVWRCAENESSPPVTDEAWTLNTEHVSTAYGTNYLNLAFYKDDEIVRQTGWMATGGNCGGKKCGEHPSGSFVLGSFGSFDRVIVLARYPGWTMGGMLGDGKGGQVGKDYQFNLFRLTSGSGTVIDFDGLTNGSKLRSEQPREFSISSGRAKETTDDPKIPTGEICKTCKNTGLTVNGDKCDEIEECGYDYVRNDCGVQRTAKDGKSGSVQTTNPYPSGVDCDFRVQAKCSVVNGVFSEVEINRNFGHWSSCYGGDHFSVVTASRSDYKMCQPHKYSHLLNEIQYDPNILIKFTSLLGDKKGFTFNWSCVDEPDRESCSAEEIENKMPEVIADAFGYSRITYTRFDGISSQYSSIQTRFNDAAKNKQNRWTEEFQEIWNDYLDEKKRERSVQYARRCIKHTESFSTDDVGVSCNLKIFDIDTLCKNMRQFLKDKFENCSSISTGKNRIKRIKRRCNKIKAKITTLNQNWPSRG